MNDQDKSKQQLIEELNLLRQQVIELQRQQFNTRQEQPEIGNLDQQPNSSYSPKDTEPSPSSANDAAIALENVWLYEQLRRERVERMRAEQEALRLGHHFLTIQYAGATIASSLDIQFILNTFTREMVDLLTVKSCIISEWNQATNNILVIARHGPEDWWQQRTVGKICNLAEEPLTQWVISERQAQYLTISQPDIDPADLVYMQTTGIKTLLIVPMEFQDRLIGLIEIIDDEVERNFTIEEMAFTQLLANQAAGAIENARLYDQAQREIAERIEIEKELRQVAARNQAILDAIPDSMFYFNHKGQLLDYKISDDDNLLVSTLLGGDVTAGRNLREVMCFPSNLTELLLTCIDKTLDTRTAQVFEYRLSTVLHPLDFEVRLVASGPNEVLVIVRDITERKRAEQQMIHAERLAALGRLAAALAHEINNPLQAIQSYVDLMLNYPLEPGENEDYLQIIRRQIDRVSEITRHVLNFSRPQSLPYQPVCLTELMEQVLVLARKQLEQNRIEVMMEITPDILPVAGVPDQLSQVFLNLIINVIEANVGRGQLHIALYAERDEAVISFTTDGPAIPPNILPHIFEPFFTTKPDGNGLGLWISHSLIQQHDGSLTAENLINDQGVVFTVKLPFKSS